MKKIKDILWIIAFLLSLLLPGCITLQGDKWSKEDKQREWLWEGMHLLIDTPQTIEIAENPDKYWEINPLLGRHPSVNEAKAYMIGTAILHPIIVNHLKTESRIFGIKINPRKIFQNFSLTGSGKCIIGNFKIDL